MSYPILYSATETKFDHNGIGILSACVSCEVTEEANGAFELAMTYPMDGVHFAEIGDRAIIKAKADQFRDPQLFRVYAISKPMNGIVTVLAEHISYDLSGIPVKPFSAENAPSALSGLKDNAVVDCPFDFWTDKATQSNFKVSTPASIRSRLGGVAGSILDVYGGEYEFDNFTVNLHNSRGLNRGVSIRYGKNLTDIQQEQNCSSVFTGVYPYWAGDTDGNTVVEIPEKIVNAPGTYNFVKIRTLDLSNEFQTKPTTEQLRARAESFVKANSIGIPNVSLSVSFSQLEQCEEYKHLKLLERVSLFDTVNVEFPALGVSSTAKAVKIVYDVIANRVKSITLGSVRANIADTIANQQQDLAKVSKDKLSISLVQKISSALSKEIMGANGGSVRLVDTNDDGEPDELYIADDPDPTQAVKVWRFNYNGWAASKNGYSGPFEFGATLADGLLAKSVTAANLVAGTIESQDEGETFYLNLDTGELNMNATAISISGKSVDTIASEKANKAQSNAISAAASDATKKANTAESNAKSYADSAAASAVNAQTQEDIFNKLTNNGSLQGIYMKDGQIYVNASYLASGKIDASVVDVINLIAEKVSSVSGSSELNIDGAVLKFLSGGNKTVSIENQYVGLPILYLTDFSNGSATNASELSPHHLKIGGTSTTPTFEVSSSSGRSKMNVHSINPGKKTLFTGTCEVGGSCTVFNTGDYDLFAVFIGDGTTQEETAILCYKHGSAIRGVGGRANVLSSYKQIHFFEANISGNTWTLVDCGFHSVLGTGSISSGYRRQLMKVVGVI